MTPHEVILEAARAIRPYLPQLLGDDGSAADDRLAELLAAPDDPGIDSDILARLNARPATRGWLVAFQDQLVPPEVARGGEKKWLPGSGEPLGGGRPPGEGEPLPGQRFLCPSGDYVWYRLVVGENIPRCPTHDLLLTAAVWRGR